MSEVLNVEIYFEGYLFLQRALTNQYDQGQKHNRKCIKIVKCVKIFPVGQTQPEPEHKGDHGCGPYWSAS